MLDIKTSKDRLEAILKFFKLALQLTKSLDPTCDEPLLIKNSCGPILELVYRTSTDEQYQSMVSIRELSGDIEDFLRQHTNPSFYLDTYNTVKQSIIKKRLDRKMNQKVHASTQDGIDHGKKKRERKYEKKREKHREKVIMDKLHR